MTDPVAARAPRVDVITIFPEYLAPLDLSLIGKARTSGLVDLRVSDLREVTTDRHRTVDDAPFGGGAGMVMRPDVWRRAVEATAGGGVAPDGRVLEPDPREVVVLVPTPSGAPLTQETAQQLADELAAPDVRAVIACGRYEGIDARLVPDLRTRSGIRRVQEFSLGDFVLNGGEVAALALLEAVVRLLPGVLGNPESVVEESFSEPLLEYPVYTRPADWEGEAVPPVLLSGNHAAVARWRRDRSLERTAQRRPALLREHPALDRADLAVLREHGVVTGRHGGLLGPVTIRRAVPGEGELLADLAAVTFPLACPDTSTLGEVRAHVAAHLGAADFERHLAASDHVVLLALDVDGLALGYALVLLGGAQGSDAPSGPDVPQPLAELSKLYLLPRARGTGLADRLMAASLAVSQEAGTAGTWLGTNRENVAAQRRYRAHGFEVVGDRSFTVGDRVHDDVVMLAVGHAPEGVAD